MKPKSIIVTERDRDLRAELAERVLVAVLGEDHGARQIGFHPLGWTRALVQFANEIEKPDDPSPESTAAMLSEVGSMIAAVDEAVSEFEGEWVKSRLSGDLRTLDTSDIEVQACDEAMDIAFRWGNVFGFSNVLSPPVLSSDDRERSGSAS